MNSSFKNINPFPLMGNSYNALDYLKVDLKDIPRNLKNTFEYDMKFYSETNNVKLLYGGYLEQRDIYDSFDLFFDTLEGYVSVSMFITFVSIIITFY